MKQVLFIITFFCSTNIIQAQWYSYTEYASCNDSIGRLSIFCDPGVYTVWWSTGDTSFDISVPPGNYTAYLFNNTDSTLVTWSGNMWHDTWDLNLGSNGLATLYIYAELPACSNINTHPSCYPNSVDTPYFTIWEDSIPIDTIINVQCTYSSYFWCCMQPGHTYDVSLTDPACGCFQSTWMYSPPRSLYVPFTSVESIERPAFSLSPNPFHTTAKLEIKNPELENENCELKIYNTIGTIVRSEEVSIHNKREIKIDRKDLVEGLYFYELRTENYELLSSGKFVVE